LPNALRQTPRNAKEVKGVEISTAEAFAIAAEFYPKAAQIWQEKLRSISREQIDEIFDRIPEGRITPIADRFARQLLEYNREKIRSIVPERQPLRSRSIDYGQPETERSPKKNREYRQVIKL
jgi:hypothetical protein